MRYVICKYLLTFSRLPFSFADCSLCCEETFYFDDGEEQNRIWIIQPDSAGNLSATANDVIGNSKMNASGNSLFMQYVLRISYNDNTLDLNIDDRMYRVSDQVVINESTMSKWGFEVGKIILVIEKKG